VIELGAGWLGPAAPPEGAGGLEIDVSREAGSPPRAAAARWATTLVEPLLSARVRDALERDMASLVAVQPDWSAAFLAGLLTDIGGTLPCDDPWRRLSGRVGKLSVGDLPPSGTGARNPDGSRHGTWRDHEDLVPLVWHAPEHDPGLMAVAAGLSDASAALVAWSTQPQAEAAQALRALRAELTPSRGGSPADAGQFWDAAAAALRWVLFRRRSAGTAVDDSWPIESAYAWLERAGEVAHGA